MYFFSFYRPLLSILFTPKNIPTLTFFANVLVLEIKMLASATFSLRSEEEIYTY